MCTWSPRSGLVWWWGQDRWPCADLGMRQPPGFHLGHWSYSAKSFQERGLLVNLGSLVPPSNTVQGCSPMTGDIEPLTIFPSGGTTQFSVQTPSLGGAQESSIIRSVVLCHQQSSLVTSARLSASGKGRWTMPSLVPVPVWEHSCSRREHVCVQSP